MSSHSRTHQSDQTNGDRKPRHRARTILASSIASLALLLTLGLMSGSAQASPTPGTAATDVNAAAPPYAKYVTTANSLTAYFYTAGDAYLGLATITVYPGGRKNLRVCDRRADPTGPGLEIDPSGAQAPIVYFDRNGSNSGCLDRNIGYSVRKWRPVLQEHAGVPTWTWPWEVFPLPHPDF